MKEKFQTIKRKYLKKRRAFTLVELIVVMAVIAVLTLLAVPKFMGYTKEARHTKLITNSRELEKASERYFMDHSDWPRLTDEPYTSEQVHEFAKRIYDVSGKEVTLDPAGNYYDIDYDKLSEYIKEPDDKMNYVLRNPVGKVYVLEDITQKGLMRDYALNDVKIVMSKENPTTADLITWTYETDGDVLAEEWQLNDEPISTLAPNKALARGSHTIKLRVKIGSKWTNWITREFLVTKIPESFQMNSSNSATVNTSVKYDEGDSLVFNYTNKDDLIWRVPISGQYKIDAIAAGSGGKGARVIGTVTLTQGDMLKFKIHSKNNGGGAGATSSNTRHPQSSGGSGSGGTVLKVNNSIVLAAGGAGGNGGNGSSCINGYIAYGGSGGNGGTIEKGYPGANGKNGRSGYYPDRVIPGGLAGVNTSSAAGVVAKPGPTLYDGGGGSAGGTYSGTCERFAHPGGGGGAGGKSFVDESVVTNSTVTPGYSSGDGTVKLTLVSEN